MSNETIPGGWTEWQFVATPNVQALFEDVTTKLLGVKYKLVAYATQIVAGTNYAFLVEGTVVVPNGKNFISVIRVYVPLEGTPSVTSIVPVTP
ncbi:hypothetical protein [Derxia gummosa]|uniref:Cystatin domain-containing protein n=1 Tax=Derxia gummosa DSM 723 TaxID=1121388 RepID=A0A8B6X720_9BURK|nr:hypothetical protein [Derxia gummosa]